MRHIAGDSLEHSRIRLERDIDKNIPLPPPMSFEEFAAQDDGDVSSVDFPRHNSRHPSFHSFEHASHLDSDFYSRHDEDDSLALDPDLGNTMSTAAHHASALTLSAGLRGRGAYNHTSGRASPSDAEYDPDRPLEAIINNRVADGISFFETASCSKSQNKTRTVPSFDPVIVDSTAELDRFVRTGHDRPTRLVYPYLSRSHSQPESDASDSDASHPRLSHALGRDFSPKRPRSAPAPAVDPPTRATKPRPGASHLNPIVYPSHLEKTAPPTKPARGGISKNAPQDSDARPRVPRKAMFAPEPRAPFSALGNKHARIHLPDATGLTSAVQSPTKLDAAYASPQIPAPRAPDLLPFLDMLQTRLQALERANSVSRRRVRELEHELEACRADVLAERTRMEECDKAVNAKAERHRAAAESRYRYAVTEKKSLEALLETLRTHVTRLTAELATHKNIVKSLRARSGHDARAEIQALRAEVERLAGEVERLKAVVEDGLRERRRARQGESDGQDIDNNGEDAHEIPAQVGIDLTYVTVPAPEVLPSREEPPMIDDLQSQSEQAEQEPKDDRERQYAQEYEQPQDREPENQYHDHPQEQRSQQSVTHHAAQDQREQVPAPEPQSYSGRAQSFPHASKLARIEAEMRERRLERSRSSGDKEGRDNDSGNGSSLNDAPPAPPVSAPRHRPHTHRAPATSADKENEDPSPPPRPAAHAARTPFPQIRGSRMERLFFSAPEHNRRTCTMCHRRRRRAPPPGAGATRDSDANSDEEIVRAYLRKKAQRAKAGDEGEGDWPPPQTVLSRVVRELEDDFSHYKAIYLELAEQYGMMDAVSNVAKRNVLADHLREVVDTLEQKGDQIASLYHLLRFQDKPLPRTRQPHPKRAAFA